jgi:hypothetical protein
MRASSGRRCRHANSVRLGLQGHLLYGVQRAGRQALFQQPLTQELPQALPQKSAALPAMRVSLQQCNTFAAWLFSQQPYLTAALVATVPWQTMTAHAQRHGVRDVT